MVVAEEDDAVVNDPLLLATIPPSNITLRHVFSSLEDDSDDVNISEGVNLILLLFFPLFTFITTDFSLLELEPERAGLLVKVEEVACFSGFNIEEDIVRLLLLFDPFLLLHFDDFLDFLVFFFGDFCFLLLILDAKTSKSLSLSADESNFNSVPEFIDGDEDAEGSTKSHGLTLVERVLTVFFFPVKEDFEAVTDCFLFLAEAAARDHPVLSKLSISDDCFLDL